MGLSFLKRKKTKDNFLLENYSPPPTPDRDLQPSNNNDDDGSIISRPLAILQPASDSIGNDEKSLTISLIHKRSMGNESKRSMNSGVGRPPVLVTPTKKQLSDATGGTSSGSAGGTPDTHIVSPPPPLMSSQETPVHSNQNQNLLNKDVNNFIIEEEKDTKIIIKEAEALLKKKNKKKKSKKEKKKKKKKNNFFGGILPSKKDTAPISPTSTEEDYGVSIPNPADISQYQTEILERVDDHSNGGESEDAGVELGLSMSMNTTQQDQNVETITAGRGKSVDIANSRVPPSLVDDDDHQPVVNVFEADIRTANGDMSEADALSETGGKNNLASTNIFDNDEEEHGGTKQAMPALIPEGSAIGTRSKASSSAISGLTSQGTKKKKKGLWKAINRGKPRKFLYSSELSQQQQGQQQQPSSAGDNRATTPQNTIPSNKTPATTTTDKDSRMSKASLGLPEVPQDITADEDSSMPSMLTEPEINKQQRLEAANMNSPQQQPSDRPQGDDGRSTPANNTARYSAASTTRPTSPGGTAGMMSSTMGETNTSASAGFTTGLTTVTSLGRTYMSSASQAGGIEKLLSVFTCGDDTTIGNAVANVTNVMQCNKIPLVCGMGGGLAKDEVDIELEMEEEHTLNFQNVSFVFLDFDEPSLFFSTPHAQVYVIAHCLILRTL